MKRTSAPLLRPTDPDDQLCSCSYGGRLRRWPAGRTFTRIMGLAARQHIARVVEMHDLLQAGKISIMPVGPHEGRIRPFVDVAQCRYLNSRLVVRRQLEPSRIDRRGLAE